MEVGEKASAAERLQPGFGDGEYWTADGATWYKEQTRGQVYWTGEVDLARCWAVDWHLHLYVRAAGAEVVVCD